jgi:putative ABC transport system substrate-binding protein
LPDPSADDHIHLLIGNFGSVAGHLFWPQSIAAGDHAIRAAQQATQIIPILGSTEDMLGAGLVHSVARPEGNTTGTSILSTELNGKRQEILMDLLPTVHHMAALADANASTPQHLQMLQEPCARR